MSRANLITEAMRKEIKQWEKEIKTAYDPVAIERARNLYKGRGNLEILYLLKTLAFDGIGDKSNLMKVEYSTKKTHGMYYAVLLRPTTISYLTGISWSTIDVAIKNLVRQGLLKEKRERAEERNQIVKKYYLSVDGNDIAEAVVKQIVELCGSFPDLKYTLA